MNYNREPIYNIVRTYLKSHPGLTSADISADKQKHYILYECAAALHYEMLLWTHLPNEVLDSIGAIRNKHVKSARDMGIDCATIDLSKVLQAKYYGPNTNITWRAASTFYAYTDSLDIGKSGRIIAHTKEAALDKVLSILKKLSFEIFEEYKIFQMIEQIMPTQTINNELPIIPSTALPIIPLPIIPLPITSIIPIIPLIPLPIIPIMPIISLIPLPTTSIIPIIPLPTISSILLPTTSIIPLIPLPTIPAVSFPINFNLRDYQKECINFIINFDNTKDEVKDEDEDDDNILRIQLACGLGKTCIIINLLMILLSQNPNNKFLILVPSCHLLYQFKDEFIKFKMNKSFGLVGDGNNNTDNNIICTYDSMHLIADYNFEIIIVDEAHHLDRNNQWNEQLNEIENNRLVFFSATLENPHFSCNLNFGVTNKYLTDYILMIPVFRQDNEYKNQLAELTKLYFEWTHILAYCNTLESAREFNNILNANNIPSAYFDGTTPIHQRQNIINEFEKSNYRVICTVNTLGEGINIPIANCAMFVEQRNSATSVIQIIGRIMRPHITKNMAYVVLPSYNEDKDLARFLNLISDYDEKIKTPSKGRINILTDLIDNTIYDDEIDVQNEAELLYIKIYENVTKMITGQWMIRYNEVVKYVNINNKIPPRSYKELGNWCHNQRTNYKNNKLSQDRINKLNEINIWHWGLNDIWLIKYNELIEYININNKLPTIVKNKELCTWCNMQKKIIKIINYRKIELIN
jgi:superfamily II DNA or RNA helicase